MKEDITEVKSLVLAYMELQRQIDLHSSNWPAPDILQLRVQQRQLLASLEVRRSLPEDKE